MFKKHIKKAPSETEKVQETYLCERVEEKIKVLSKEEIWRVLEKESCNLNRIDLVYNIDSFSTKWP